ncbi:uncharacterized protein Dwil_GK18938 [Drosophila willistoni]|uniref:Uncharacterized protein n=1 Tax=Drosophila willistoni TaxID=7260 RepID=B4NHT4_DROWI|nr:uncharacterized protein LOC6650929 [Drosophila willistoni]EDW84694.1 uncharacterized protein Dwil_GK18938 [Drosophila willistoni]
MALSARHGFAGVLLYIILVLALIHPKMHITLTVESYFFNPNYLATFHLSYKLDGYMLFAALPLTALVVIAWSRWDSESEKPLGERILIISFLCLYVVIVLSNVIANGLVIQHVMSTFNQNQLLAWRMYFEMQISFLKAIFWSCITRKPLYVHKQVYAMQ